MSTDLRDDPIPRHRSRRPRRTPVLVSALVVVTALGLAGPLGTATAAPAAETATDGSIGRGFSLRTGPGGGVLVWSGAPVRVGDARPEFRLGQDVLGYPRELGGGLELALSPSDAARVLVATADLQAWSGGRRLDAPAADTAAGRFGAAQRSTPPPVLPEADETPTVRTNPAAPGRYRTERLSYSLDPITIPGYATPVEMLAEVTRPVRATERMPLVLLLHGRHATCFRGGPEGESSIDWPCPPGWSEIPSHLGYRYITDVLASQGFLAVSISANGINGQDAIAPDSGASARSQLIRKHLDLWDVWNREGTDPWGGIFHRKVDLRRVALVGHSRGGEGANRAAVDASSSDPYRIVGIATFGPTAFGRQVTPDVTSATIMGTCDGDVFDLQGQAYVDGSRDIAASPALRSAVISIGANHNYFNTEWTPGLAQAPAFDDWFDPTDPTCGDAGSVRLTVEEQQSVGAAYTLALVRLSVDREERMLRLLDGSRVKPAAIGRADIGINAVGGYASLLYRPEADGTPVLSGGLTGGECLGYLNPSAPQPGQVPCGGDRPEAQVPHWQASFTSVTRPAPQALELTWSAPGGVARLDLPAAARNLSGFDTIDIRVANDPDLDPAHLAVRLRDARGAVDVLDVSLESVAAWPGTGDLRRVHARTVKADLESAHGVDLRRIAAVELLTRSPSGHVWVLDAAAVRARVPAPVPLDLPRVSVDIVEVPEGDGEPVPATVTVRLEEPLAAPATVHLQYREGLGFREGRVLTLPAGSSGVVTTVPFTVVGDDLYSQRFPGGFDFAYTAVSAVTGALTGDYLGGVRTIEDDPVPTLGVEQASVTGVEGGSLTWTLRLSAPSAGAVYFVVAEPPDGVELDTDDVDPVWLEAQLGVPPPVPAEPLSELFGGFGLVLFAVFGPGDTEASVDIPLRADADVEGVESVRFDVLGVAVPDPTLPPGGVTLTGVVAAG